MEFSYECGGCGALYTLRTSELPPQGIKVTCPRCLDYFVLRSIQAQAPMPVLEKLASQDGAYQLSAPPPLPGEVTTDLLIQQIEEYNEDPSDTPEDSASPQDFGAPDTPVDETVSLSEIPDSVVPASGDPLAPPLSDTAVYWSSDSSPAMIPPAEPALGADMDTKPESTAERQPTVPEVHRNPAPTDLMELWASDDEQADQANPTAPLPAPQKDVPSSFVRPVVEATLDLSDFGMSSYALGRGETSAMQAENLAPPPAKSPRDVPTPQLPPKNQVKVRPGVTSNAAPGPLTEKDLSEYPTDEVEPTSLERMLVPLGLALTTCVLILLTLNYFSVLPIPGMEVLRRDRPQAAVESLANDPPSTSPSTQGSETPKYVFPKVEDVASPAAPEAPSSDTTP